MAPGRRAVGGLATVALVLALVVAGCGGGDSSASETTGGGSSPTDGSASREAKGALPGEGESSQRDQSTAAATKKKHPPLKLPTGKPETGPTAKQQEAVPTADITVSLAGGITSANTCKGDEISPAVEWSHVPPDTAELALFVMPLQPVDGKLYFDWAVAGIDPSLDGLEAGEVPEGAVVGRNGAGKNEWALCPQGSAPENYIFALYALPKSVEPKEGFDSLELRKEATALSDSVGLFSVAY